MSAVAAKVVNRSAGEGTAAIEYESLIECAPTEANSVAACWDIRAPARPSPRDRLCLFIHNRKFVPLRTHRTCGTVNGACLFQGLTPGYYDVRLFLGDDEDPHCRSPPVLVGPRVNVKAHVDGGEIIVTWSKPDGGPCPGKGDWVGLYAPTKRSNKQYLAWRDASKTLIVTFPAPRTPGDYGVRYFLENAGYAFSGRAIASVPRIDYLHVHPWATDVHVSAKIGVRWVFTSEDVTRGTFIGLFSKGTDAARIAVPVVTDKSKRKDARVESNAILDLSTVFLPPGDYVVKLYNEKEGPRSSICESPLTLCQSPVAAGTVQKPRSFEDALDMMAQHPTSPAYQETSMEAVGVFIKDDPSLKANQLITQQLMPLMVECLRNHLYSPSVCEIACELLLLLVTPDNMEQIARNGMHNALLAVAERYVWSPYILPPLTVLCKLFTNQSCLSTTAIEKVIRMIMTILFDTVQSYNVLATALKALRNIAQHDITRPLVSQCCALAAAIKMQKLFQDSPQILEDANRLVFLLVENNDEAKKEVAQRDGIPILISVLKKAFKMPSACEAICDVLASVSKGNTLNRMQIAEQGGVRGLLKVLRIYYGTVITVTESVCKALESLCQSWDCCFEVVETKGDQLLVEVAKFYAEKSPETATRAYYALKAVWETHADDAMAEARKAQLQDLRRLLKIE